MKTKTQRKAIRTAAGFVLVLGVGYLGWAILFPPELLTQQVQAPVLDSRQLIEPPPSNRLEPLLKKRLQAPLDPIQRKPTPARVEVKRVTWPSITVDCIFFGQDSKLAVVSSNNQVFTCAEGDEVKGVSIVQIYPDSVDAIYQGEKRSLRADDIKGSNAR